MDLSYPMVSNSKLVTELKLPSRFITRRHEQIFSLLCFAMFGTTRASNTRIARDSSTCFPDFQKGVDFKKNIWHYTTTNFDKILDLIWENNLEQAYDDHDFLIAYYMGSRAQADKITCDNGVWQSKDRYINDYLYAKTSGKQGKRWIADKSVLNNYKQKINSHFKMRRRSVFGISGSANYTVNSIFAQFREFYLNEYEFTWKHRTSEEITQKISKYKHCVGTDVASYDNTFQAWMFDAVCDELTNYIDERLVKLIGLMLHAPYFQSSAGEEADPKWMGNPLNPASFKLNMGLPSGIPPNPDLGKLMKTFDFLCMFDDFFHDVIEVGVDAILRGHHPSYGLLNMGDDSLILTNDESFNRWLINSLANGERIASYFADEKEKGLSFLGNVLHRPVFNGSVELTPNIVSFFVNWFVPEKCTTHKMRQYWYIGWRERIYHFSQAPGFSTAWEILSRLFRDTFGVSVDTYSLTAEEHSKMEPIPIVSAIDRIVLEDPSKLVYRFSEADVNRELYDSLVTTIDPEQTVGFTSKYIFKQ